MRRRSVLPLVPLVLIGLPGLLTLAAPSPAHANAIARPYKFINHIVRFDDIPRFGKSYRFYVVAKLDKDKVSTISPDKSGEIHYNNVPTASDEKGVFLYAVPTELPLKADGDPKEQWFTETTKGVLISSRLETAVRRSRWDDPHDTYLTRYRIAIKDVPATKAEPTHKTLTLAIVSNGWVEPKVDEPKNLETPTPAKLASTRGIGGLLALSLVALFGLVGRLRSEER